MSVIKELSAYSGAVKTTLSGVEDSKCTYEVVDGMLILRTTTSDTLHITPEIGKQLVKLIIDHIL